ncbi:hypothetical protein ccbrp13_61100 [Ktedonobacteria bacterium brp13]|nr:hypothetical protein ccbrp13_61100 [Ktedonobacteria bacterium brp13]
MSLIFFNRAEIPAIPGMERKRVPFFLVNYAKLSKNGRIYVSRCFTQGTSVLQKKQFRQGDLSGTSLTEPTRECSPHAWIGRRANALCTSSTCASLSMWGDRIRPVVVG